MENRLCTAASAYASTCAEASVDEIASADKPMKNQLTERSDRRDFQQLCLHTGVPVFQHTANETARLASTNSAQV